VHNAVLVQRVNSQNNLCHVESCQFFIESLKPRQQGMCLLLCTPSCSRVIP
jgi:hypothetical protein